MPQNGVLPFFAQFVPQTQPPISMLRPNPLAYSNPNTFPTVFEESFG